MRESSQFYCILREQKKNRLPEACVICPREFSLDLPRVDESDQEMHGVLFLRGGRPVFRALHNRKLPKTEMDVASEI